MNCTTCGGLLVAGARFCSQCGSAIAEAVPAHDPLRSLLEAALGTHYEIRRELGRGGMGAVFLAYERGLDRDVAIKVLPPDRAESEANRGRFRMEARAAARLSHANIVPLHTFGEHDGMLYYVMGYVEGESLADRLMRQGHLPEHETRQILLAVADALHYGHGRGVLHRDVKPHNILLEAGSNRALLTDFGISKLSSESSSATATGTILGTPDYMSPEQAAGSPDIDGRSDLYSLGVAGYEMLSGRLPFPGRTPGESIAKRLVEDPPRLSASEPGVSVDLIDGIMKCLNRNPASRWRDCGEFASALRADVHPEPEPFESIGLLWVMSVYAAIIGVLIARTQPELSIVALVGGRLVPAFAVLVGVVTIGVAAFLRRKGHTARQISQRIFREPASWTGWYPASLRRPGNVWNRLPPSVQVLRARYAAVVGVFYLAFGLLIYGTFAAENARIRSWITSSFVAAVFITIAAFGVSLLRVRRQLRQSGAGQREAEGIAYAVPPSRTGFWSRPSVAVFLNGQSVSRAASTDTQASAPTQ